MGKMETCFLAKFRHPIKSWRKWSKKQIIQIRTETNPSVMNSDGSKFKSTRLKWSLTDMLVSQTSPSLVCRCLYQQQWKAWHDRSWKWWFKPWLSFHTLAPWQMFLNGANSQAKHDQTCLKDSLSWRIPWSFASVFFFFSWPNSGKFNSPKEWQ